MSDDKTIRVYDARADEYAAMTYQHNTDDPHLLAFIEAVAKGGRVLDLGCGPGASAAVMAQSGLQVEATDASAEMVARANQHPGVSARQAVFDDLTGTDLYDGIWANFSLLHATRSALPGHLEAIKTALKPGGCFVIGMKLGTGEGPDRMGRYYTYYSMVELTDLLSEAGFRVAEQTTGRGTGLDGSESDWVVMTAHG